MQTVKVIDLDVKEMKTNGERITKVFLESIPSIMLDDEGHIAPVEVTNTEIYYQVKTIVDYSGNYTLFAIKKEDYEMFDSLLKLSNRRIQEFRAETFEKGYREGKYKADKLLREMRQMTFLQRLKWLFTN